MGERLEVHAVAYVPDARGGEFVLERVCMWAGDYTPSLRHDELWGFNSRVGW